MRLAALALVLLVSGCATVPLPSTTPSPYGCDARMVDHNRRACMQRGGAFLEPQAGHCGVCGRRVLMPDNR